MLVVANRLQIAEGYEAEFRELFEERVEQIQERSGLINVEILKPIDAEEYVVQAYWDSREAFDQWHDSDDFREAHANLPAEMFTGANQLDIYELVMTTNTDQQ